MIPREGLGDFTQRDESEFAVERTTDVNTMLFGFCGYSSGVMPFCVRSGGRFVPAGAKYEREISTDGNDRYEFTWQRDGQFHRVAFSLMDDSVCEVLMPKSPFEEALPVSNVRAATGSLASRGLDHAKKTEIEQVQDIATE